ncbi:MAG: YybH family protein [Gemmatimonadota bacterium]
MVPRGMISAAAVGAIALAGPAGCAPAEEAAPPVEEPVHGALIEADRRFAAATAERGAEGWASSFAEDGVMLLPGGEVRGREEILELMTDFLADTGYSLTWEPQREEVSRARDIGYTVGRYATSTVNAGGERVEAAGAYVTIWRRSDMGEWQVILDAGVPDPGPADVPARTSGGGVEPGPGGGQGQTPGGGQGQAPEGGQGQAPEGGKEPTPGGME